MKKKIFKMVAATLAAVTVFGITGCNEKKEESTEVATLKWYFPGKEYRDTPEVEAKINEIIDFFTKIVYTNRIYDQIVYSRFSQFFA